MAKIQTIKSKEPYRHLLGINEPWTVERVEPDMTRGQIDVYVGHAKGEYFACPECGQEHAVYDHSAERVWRHLDSCQFMTYLPARRACRVLFTASGTEAISTAAVLICIRLM